METSITPPRAGRRCFCKMRVVTLGWPLIERIRRAIEGGVHMPRVRTVWLVLAGAIALAACASNPPASSTGAPSANGAAASPAASAAENSVSSNAPKTDLDKVPYGYRLVVRNGTEYYCRYEPVAGSRTLRDEICLTKEQMAQGDKSVDDLMRQVGTMPVNPQVANPSPRGR